MRLLSRVIPQGHWHSGQPFQLVSVVTPVPEPEEVPSAPDPFAQGFAAGLAQGQAEGRQALQAARAAHRAELDRLNALYEQRWARMEAGVCAVIARLVAGFVGEALREPEALARRVTAALAELAPAGAEVSVRVGPGAGEPPAGLAWEEDTRLGAGDFWLEAGSVEVDGHLDPALARLEERLLEELPAALVESGAGDRS